MEQLTIVTNQHIAGQKPKHFVGFDADEDEAETQQPTINSVIEWGRRPKSPYFVGATAWDEVPLPLPTMNYGNEKRLTATRDDTLPLPTMNFGSHTRKAAADDETLPLPVMVFKR